MKSPSENKPSENSAIIPWLLMALAGSRPDDCCLAAVKREVSKCQGGANHKPAPT